MKFLFLLACSILVICTSCANVKPYQLSKINNPEMKMASKKINMMESNFQTYREGASGANGGKSGGGCGCN